MEVGQGGPRVVSVRIQRRLIGARAGIQAPRTAPRPHEPVPMATTSIIIIIISSSNSTTTNNATTSCGVNTLNGGSPPRRRGHFAVAM